VVDAGSSRLWRLAVLAALAAWPFVFFFDFVLELGGTYRTPVADFLYLYYPYKAYLLGALAEGRFPLWSPSEGAGYPFYSNPFAQAFYPLNAVLVPLHSLAGGYSPLDHQRFTVFALSIFAVGLHLWLSRLVPNGRAVLFAVAVMAVSFRMSEIRRFPNAVHAAAWYPWLLYGVTGLFSTASARGRAGFAALIFAALVLLLTSGYPYYVYYAPFLLLPYAAVLASGGLPQVARGRGLWKPLAAGCLAAAGAAAVCAPYLYKMSELLRATTDRGGENYVYSSQLGFGFKDTLGSLLYPPLAQTEGVYYFGMIGLLLLAWLLTGGGLNVRWTAVALLWFATVVSITHSEVSYVFRLLWLYVPGFSSLRMWGRLNIVLVPFLAWMLALAYEAFERRLGTGTTGKGRIGLAAFCVIGLALVAIQVSLYRANAHDEYWNMFPALHPRAIWFPIAGAAALLAISGLLFWTARRPLGPRALRIVLAVAVLGSAADLWPVGRQLWLHDEPAKLRRPVRPAKLAMASLAIPRRDVDLFLTLTPASLAAPGMNWHYRAFSEFYRREAAHPGLRDRLLGVSDGTRLFFSDDVHHPDLGGFLADADRHPGTVRVRSYDGDRLVARARTPRAGWLSFIDNWDPDWEASVDGQPVVVARLFGTFKSVPVPAGSHRVEFRYVPRLGRWKWPGSHPPR
jgi:hypothetical protein